MRIGHAGTILLVCMAVATAVAATSNISEAWRERQQALQLRDWIETRTILSRVTISLSLERSITQVGLRLPIVLPDRFRTLLDTQRESVDDQFDSLEGRAGEVRLHRREAFLTRVAELRGELAQLRQAADADLCRAQQERSAGAVALPDTFKAHIERWQASRLLLESDTARVPAAAIVAASRQKVTMKVRNRLPNALCV